jgi:hypothetical protein
MALHEWPNDVVDVVSLVLDERNVRLDLGDATPSQEAIIEDLFINQDAIELAQSIALHGLFPNDLPIVIIESGQMIVVEGNRRVAALKGLLNPDIIPRYRSRLDNLGSQIEGSPISAITVVVAPSREAAMKVVARIHTTSSRKPWPTLRQAYFYYAQVESGRRTTSELQSDYPGVDVPRFVRMWQMHTIARSIDYGNADDARRVANQTHFPISTLERVYASDSFKDRFRVSFSDAGDVSIGSDRQSFDNAYRSVILDIVNKVVTSRRLNTEEQIRRFLDRWAPQTLAKADQDSSASEFQPKDVPTPQRRRRRLAPKDLACSLPYPAIRRMLDELKGIDYYKFPNAAHDLLRSFLECSLKAYFDHRRIQVPRRAQGKTGYAYLKDVLEFAEGHFGQEKRALVQVIRVIHGAAGGIQGAYVFSEDFLNAINHNHAVFSTGDQVKAAWDQMEPLLRYVVDPPGGGVPGP